MSPDLPVTIGNFILRVFVTLCLYFRVETEGGPGGSLSKGFIAKSYTTVCPWILTWWCGGIMLLGSWFRADSGCLVRVSGVWCCPASGWRYSG